ncbi:hypothetical protein DL95DRAFT_467163 [Leptodontidium sp. 2 PMI_412]|nr:hypothetical protein DL95DRAFT_467163 [Leptodontidium sp. 2 PMI_412]
MAEAPRDGEAVGNGEGDKITPAHTVGAPVSPPLSKSSTIGHTPLVSSPKAPLHKRIWTKIGLTPFVMMIMFKPAVAATIAMVVYQRQEVAKIFWNFGYLIIIVSITTVPILPRGKFLLNVGLSLSLTCLAAGMVILGQYAGIKAREHTTAPGAPITGYNSTASVVNAIFLMLNVFGINDLHAARPAFSIPSIQYSVFTMVGFVYGPQEPTIAASQRFVKEVLYTFLTGQAISAFVCLLVIPVSSRKVFLGEATGFLQSCRKLLKAQLEFVEVLKHSKICASITANPESPKEEKTCAHEDLKKDFNKKLRTLTTLTTDLLALGAKLREDVLFAKREIAFGHFRETDIHEFHTILGNIMIPISGLSTIADISERMDLPSTEALKLPKSVFGNSSQTILENEQKAWTELVHTTGTSFEVVADVLDESIVHILALLKLGPDKKAKKTGQATADVEKGTEPSESNDGSFADSLEMKIEDFRKKRSKILHAWAEERGLDSVFRTTAKHAMYPPSEQNGNSASISVREVIASKRLHVLLYMEFVFPALRTVVKLIRGLINGDDSNPDMSNFNQVDGSGQIIQFGDSCNGAKDPEHLPPKNLWQSFGNHLRAVPRFFGSAPVSFGARVTIAVMSIAIIAYLKPTYKFFKQRVVWCLAMTSMSMSPTSGSAVFNLMGNLAFTVFRMVGSFINWYIVDQKTAGVIVFFFLFMMFYFYFAARFPRFLTCIVAGALTHVLIIGYELQVRVVGLPQAIGQPFYPIYELAPYRLLTVGAGVLAGYIWTILPVPISEVSVLRRDLGASLFLLANYLSCVTATVDLRVLEPNSDDAGLLESHGHKLDKVRQKVLVKQIALLNTYASSSFPTTHTRSAWLSSFASTRIQNHSESHKLISLLSLLSASITNGQALPPYLKTPDSFRLSDEITADVGTVLDLANVDEPGFRAVAVVKVAQRCVVDSTERIVGLVRELVGEVDFGWRVVCGTGDVSGSSSLLGGDV